MATIADSFQVEGQGLWESLLKQAASIQRPPNSKIIFVGSESCEKNYVVDLLKGNSASVKNEQKRKDQQNRIVLRYDHFEVIDSSENKGIMADCPPTVNIWICDEPRFSSIVNRAVKPVIAEHSAVIIALDMMRPWDLISAAEHWLYALKDVIIDVPVIFIGCNYDLFAHQEAQYEVNVIERQKREVFVQRRLRILCLSRGAALVYISKNDKNSSLLRDMIMNHLYPDIYEFDATAEVNGAIFIPWNWDSSTLIDSCMDKNLVGYEDSVDYNDVICRPNSQPQSLSYSSQHAQVEDIEPEEDWLAELSKLDPNQFGSPSITDITKNGAAISTLTKKKSMSSTYPALVKTASESDKLRSFYENLIGGASTTKK